MSLFIDRGGYVDATRITLKVFPLIERGKMGHVNGIVVHQTGGPTADGAFGSYSKKRHDGSYPNGAHFLIEKDGTIYQTASLFRITNHVGNLQSRCLATQKCSPTELKAARALDKTKGNKARADAVNKAEMPKEFPDRYPSNVDAIGIELVGEAPETKKGEFEFVPVTAEQTSALKWLVNELVDTLGVSMNEVYRHPVVGRKNDSEARTAIWRSD